MYDWPEIGTQTDALFSAIAERLSLLDQPAPQALTRDREPEALWQDPDLLLAQTCGYPYATVLKDKVKLVVTPGYAVDGLTPGTYCSVIITSRAKGNCPLGDLMAGRLAYNGRVSQSGFAAALRLMESESVVSNFPPLETGSHRASIRAVADGLADWAAIDAVSFALAERHEPATRAVTIAARTPLTPGLPLITSRHRTASEVGLIADAVEKAIETLPETIRRDLLLTGTRRWEPADYLPLAAPLPLHRLSAL